jgi:hypothetical protein
VDPQEIQARVAGFAQKLLGEAHGDPVRALGLLVLVLDGVEVQDPEQYAQLLSEVRRALFPETEFPEPVRPLQHLAGEVSWEGYQHCLRCGMVLVKGQDPALTGFPSGFVYQIEGQFQLGCPDEFEPCGH